MSEDDYQDSRQGSALMVYRNGHKISHDLKSYDQQYKQNGFLTNGYTKSLKRNHDQGRSGSGHNNIGSGHKKHHHHKNSSHSKHGHHQRNQHNKKSQEDRFSRTANALKQAGLLELTLLTAQLMQDNDEIQKEIDKLQEETVSFSKTLHAQLEEKLKASTNGANGYTRNTTGELT